jgi:hypothetical protein
MTFQIPGKAYLLAAVFIFGTASAVTRQLTDLGARSTSLTVATPSPFAMSSLWVMSAPWVC